MTDSSTSRQQRRIWSDPYFYAVLGLIGGTYVVLIVAMLLADATYMFTSDMSRQVTLDFSSSPGGQLLSTGDIVTDQFAPYGLLVTTGDDQHPAAIIDSGRPSAANSDLGTPHIDFGGPGIGDGGRDDTTTATNPGTNNTPLGNVLVVANNMPPFPVNEKECELVVNWVEPVHVDSVLISQLNVPGGEIEWFDRSGQPIGAQRIDEISDEPQQRITVDQSGISRMVMTLPGSASDAEIVFTAPASAQTQLRHAARSKLDFGHLRVVPQGTTSVTPNEIGGTLVFRWEDPIRLDRVQLLNVDRDGGRLITYDMDGKVLATKRLENVGENSVQAVEYNLAVAGQESEQPRVARLEVQLPCGGAVAGLDFTWSGRVRTAWQRRHPGLSRLVYNPLTVAFGSRDIRYSIRLSLISCTISAILSLWVAIPIGYLMSRHRFFGRNLLDAILDIPIVLPPLVVGLSLLILFQFMPFTLQFGPIRIFGYTILPIKTSLQELVVYQIPAVILAQFAVACAFAVRTMRATFDQIDARREQVALTLGCSRFQAFGMIVLPEASKGILTAGTLAWARSLGEFGPLLIFAGATRNKTEVLSTTVFLELSIGDLGASVAVSLIMVFAAVIVLVVARLWGNRSLAV